MGYLYIICLSLLVVVITFRSVLTLHDQAYTSSTSNLFANGRNILQTGDELLTVSLTKDLPNPVLTASVTSHTPLRDYQQQDTTTTTGQGQGTNPQQRTGGNGGSLFRRSTQQSSSGTNMDNNAPPTLPRMSEPQHFGRREHAGIGEVPLTSTRGDGGDGTSSSVSSRYSIPGMRIVPNTGTTSTTKNDHKTNNVNKPSQSVHTMDSSSNEKNTNDVSPFITNGEEPMKEAAWPILHHFLALLTKGSLDESKLHAPRLSSYLNNDNTNDGYLDEENFGTEVEDDDGNTETLPTLGAKSSNEEEEDTDNDSYKLSSRKGILDEIYGEDSSTGTSLLRSTKRKNGKNKNKGSQKYAELLSTLPTFETIRASLSSTSKVFLTASSFNDGIHGPVLRSSLLSIFDNDVESKRLYESFRNEFIVPTINPLTPDSSSNGVALQSRQNICNLVPSNPFLDTGSSSGTAGATSDTGIYSPIGTGGSSGATTSTVTTTIGSASGVLPKPNTVTNPINTGTANTLTTITNTVSSLGTDPTKIGNTSPSASGTGTVPLSSVISPSTDAIRDAILKLAENDYRTSVTELLTFFQTVHREAESSASPPHPLKDTTLSPGAAGPSLTLGSSKAIPNVPPVVPALSSSSSSVADGTSASSPNPLLWLDSHQLPPKPFLALDGRIDIGNQPILILGSGAGFLSLRLAMNLPNNTIVSLAWASKAEGSTIDKETIPLPSSIISPTAIHAILKTELGMQKVGNSWVIDTMVEPTIGRLQALITYLRSRLILDPLQGGWISETMKKTSKVGQTSLNNGKESRNDDGSGTDSTVSSSAFHDVSLDDYHLEAIPSHTLRILNGISQKLTNPRFDLDTLINEVYDNNQDVERIALGTLIIDDLGHLLSSSFTTMGKGNGDNDEETNDSFDILPFEFERFLGKLLTLSRHTIIYGSLPDLRFFSYWSSLEALVRVSVVAVGMVPTIRSLNNNNNNGNTGTTASTVPSWQGVINNKGSSSINGNTMGVLVTVQTPLESEYETSLYLRAYALTSAVTKTSRGGNVPSPLAMITKSLSMNHMDSRSITGMTIHYCPDTVPRIRKGAIHPSYALMNTVPLDFLLGLGLIRSDTLFLASQMAYLDLPTGLITMATTSDFVIRGSQLLLATDDVPPVTSGDFTVSSSSSTSPNDVAAALHIRKHAKRTAQAAAKVAEQLATEAAAKKKKEPKTTTTKRKAAVTVEEDDETVADEGVNERSRTKKGTAPKVAVKGKKTVAVANDVEEEAVDETVVEENPDEVEIEVAKKPSQGTRKIAPTVTVDDEEDGEESIDAVEPTNIQETEDVTEEILPQTKKSASTSSLFAKPKTTSKSKERVTEDTTDDIDTIVSTDKLTKRKPAPKAESIEAVLEDDTEATEGIATSTTTVGKKLSSSSSSSSSSTTSSSIGSQKGMKAPAKNARNVVIPPVTTINDGKAKDVPIPAEEENEDLDDTASLLAEPGSAAPLLPNEDSTAKPKTSGSTKAAPKNKASAEPTVSNENEQEAEDYADLIKPVGSTKSTTTKASVISTDESTDDSLELLSASVAQESRTVTDSGSKGKDNSLDEAEEDSLLLDDEDTTDLIKPNKKGTAAKPAASLLFRGRKLQETNGNNKNTNPNSVLFSRNRNGNHNSNSNQRNNPPSLLTNNNNDNNKGESITTDTDEMIQDEPLLPYLTDTKWENIRPRKLRSLTSSLSLASSKRLSGWAASVGDAQAELVLQEAPAFRSWWRSLRNELLETSSSTTDSSSPSSSPSSLTGPILVHGSGNALLSVKLARMFPQSTIVSTKTNEFILDPTTGTSESEAHADLLRLIGISNNFIIPSSCSSASSSTASNGYFDSPLFSQATVLALAASHDSFRYALYGNDIWSSFVGTTLSAGIVSQDSNSIRSNGRSTNDKESAEKVAGIIMEQWEEKLGGLLRISGTSIFELVPFPRLMAPLASLTPFCEGPCAFLGSSIVTNQEAQETSDSLESRGKPFRTDGGNEGIDNDGDGFLESIPWSVAQSRASSAVTESFFDGEDGNNGYGSDKVVTGASVPNRKGSQKPINSIFSDSESSSTNEESTLANTNPSAFLEDLLAADETGIFESDTDMTSSAKNAEEEDGSMNNEAEDIVPSAVSSRYASTTTASSFGRTTSTLFKRTTTTNGRRLIENYPSRGYPTTDTSSTSLGNTVPPSRLRGTSSTSNAIHTNSNTQHRRDGTGSSTVPVSPSTKPHPAKRILQELQSFLSSSQPTLVARLPRTNKHALSASEIVLQKYASQTGTSTAFDRLYEPYRQLIVAAARKARLHDIEIRFIIEPVKPSHANPNTTPPRIFIRVDSHNWAKKGASVSRSTVQPSFPSSISFHTLLTLGVPSTIRARLIRMFLNFPFPSIVRAAEERGIVATMSPLALRLERVPLTSSRTNADEENTLTTGTECAYTLQYSLPAGNQYDAVSFVSSLCLTLPYVSGTDNVYEGTNEISGKLGTLDTDVQIRELWAALASQLIPLDTATGGAKGKFSFVEYGSGLGQLSLAVARAFPEATVLSIEDDEENTNAHLAASLRGGILNNIIAKTNLDYNLFKNMHDSPEFFRYQALSLDLSEMLLRAGNERNQNSALSALQGGIGTMFATAATSFVRIPPAAALSLAFTIFTDAYPSTESGNGWVIPTDIHPLGSYTGRYIQHSLYSHSKSSVLGLRTAFAPSIFENDRLSSSSSSLPYLPWSTLGSNKDKNDGGFTALISALEENEGRAYRASFSDRFAFNVHPRPSFVSAELRLLSALVRAPSGTSIRITAAAIPAIRHVPASMDDIVPSDAPMATVSLSSMNNVHRGASGAWKVPVLLGGSMSSGLVRVDIANLTRHVNHHFQSDIDGHSRKYTLRVQANYTAGGYIARYLNDRQFTSFHDLVASSRTNDASTYIDDIYNLLPPGNHPNFGHTIEYNGYGACAALANEASKRAEEQTEAEMKLLKKKGPKAQEIITIAMQEAADRVYAECTLDDTLPPQSPAIGEVARTLSLSPGTVYPGVSSIILTRDFDNAFIPYDSVHGITLISGLRLGLLPSLRSRAYHQFVSLPLYQDMAPWNIVFLGAKLDYIDYDTRDHTYDMYVPKAYEVMEVLFNYKRTVEDFKKCNGKSGNPYNFPFVSDCVASSSAPTCKDSARPVPCGDGTCRSDYISCLRAISENERTTGLRKDILWAFRTYAKTQTNSNEKEKGEDEGEGGYSGSDTLVTSSSSSIGNDIKVDTPDNYLATLFGTNDRSRGTAADTGRKEDKEDNDNDGTTTDSLAKRKKKAAMAAAAAEARRRQKRSEGGGTKLGPGHEFLSPGGSLEYTSDGIKRK